MFGLTNLHLHLCYPVWQWFLFQLNNCHFKQPECFLILMQIQKKEKRTKRDNWRWFITCTWMNMMVYSVLLSLLNTRWHTLLISGWQEHLDKNMLYIVCITLLNPWSDGAHMSRAMPFKEKTENQFFLLQFDWRQHYLMHEMGCE